MVRDSVEHGCHAGSALALQAVELGGGRGFPNHCQRGAIRRDRHHRTCPPQLYLEPPDRIR